VANFWTAAIRQGGFDDFHYCFPIEASAASAASLQ
jgi:hypothetical protein